MKKLVVMIAAAVFALALAGCSSNIVMSTDDDESVAGGNDAATDDSTGADQNSTEDEAESTDANAEPEEVVEHGTIAWSDSEDAANAAEAAGFTNGFTLPDPLPIGDYNWSQPSFNNMDNVADAHYDGEVVSVTVRKGEGVPLEDLSANTTDYGHEWTQNCDGIEVFCQGYEEGTANFIEWEADGCSYDVWCAGTHEDNIGMSPEEVTAMVAGVK